MTTSKPGLAPTRHELASGAVSLAKESRMSPAVTIMAGFRAGSLHDTDERLGLAHLCSKVMDRGTATRSADQIADELDGRGVSLAVSTTRHALSLSCTCLAEDFEHVLGLVGDVVVNPAFPDEEIATKRGEIITSIRQDEDSPAVMAVETLFAMLYPNRHPYGRHAKGTVETVERITRHELIAFHAARVVPSSLSIVVVGDVEVPRAIEAVSLVFGDWRGPASEPDRVPSAGEATSRQSTVVPMMGKSQADIAYGFTTIRRADPLYHAAVLMNNVFGQYALGGRLGTRIREKQGMAYYAFSAFDANLGEGPLVIRAGVNPANVDRAIDSIDEEVARMAATGVTDEELEDSKRYLVGSMPRTLETNAGIATFLQNAEYFGLGLDYDVRLPGLIEAVTRDEVNAVAGRFLDPDRAAIAIAGPCEAGKGAAA
jgi:zinc protease